MPMDGQQRAEAVKNFNASPGHTNATRCRQVSKFFFRLIRRTRGMLEQIDRQFQMVPGADLAAKQTEFFDCISAESDGDLILHDFGQMLDAMVALANDYRQPGEPVLVPPFTDADVTAYLP